MIWLLNKTPIPTNAITPATPVPSALPPLPFRNSEAALHPS
jgi:hypothetical protein